MKALSSAMLALTIAALPIVGSSQSGEKTLKTVAGTVTYGASSTPTTKLAKNAATALADNDYAATQANSKATISLPDSSMVTVGENSNVQMKSFDGAGGTNAANFVVVGKVRFQVEHPNGAKANYTFKTATGQIAVRGTVGDIFAMDAPGGGLQVNVYALTDPALPVQVTLVNGQVFTLAAGQSLVVTSTAGALVGSVGAVTNTTFAPFAQLGAPVNASSLGLTTTTAAAGATGAAAGTAAAATAAAAVGAAAIVTSVSANKNNNSTPPSTPSPAPTSTSVPITISGHPANATPQRVPVTAPGPVIVPGPATVPGPGNVPGPQQGPRFPHPLTRPTPPVN